VVNIYAYLNLISIKETGKKRSSKKEQKKLARAESSATPKPKFEEPSYSPKNAYISELQSMKNHLIEDKYSTDNENHKEIFKRLINRLKDRQVDIVEDYFWRNGSQPMNSNIGNIL